MGKPKIICIDDERSVLDALRSMLERALEDSAEVECFKKPKDALKYLDDLDDKNVPILLIADEIMPGEIQGSRLFETVNEKYPHIKKILLTGKANYEEIGYAFKKAKTDEYIAKPWDEKEIISKIQKLLQKDEILEAIEALVKQSPNPDEPFLVTAAGEKYSLKDIYTEIKNKTSFGQMYRKTIHEAIINYMHKQKSTDLRELKNLEAKYIGGVQ